MKQVSPVSGHMPLTADYSHARSHFLFRAPETLHLRVFSSTPSPPMGPTEVLSSRCSRRQPSDKHGWGSEGQHPSSLVSGLGRMFCTMPQVSSAECGLQCLAKVPEGLTVDCPELICSPRHLLPIPFLPLSCSRTGVFRGRLPDKTLALESVSQHLLLREPGLRDRTVLTRWGQKLPENAAHTEDARQRPRTRDTPVTASCRRPDLARPSTLPQDKEVSPGVPHVLSRLPVRPQTSLPPGSASAHLVQREESAPRAAGPRLDRERVTAARAADSSNPSLPLPANRLLAASAVLLSASRSQAWASPGRC